MYKKILEYTTIVMSVVVTFCMIVQLVQLMRMKESQ